MKPDAENTSLKVQNALENNLVESNSKTAEAARHQRVNALEVFDKLPSEEKLDLPFPHKAEPEQPGVPPNMRKMDPYTSE